MRAALLTQNACAEDAIGNQLAAKVRALTACGWAVRLFAESLHRLHPALTRYACAHQAASLWRNRADRSYLRHADLILAEYGSAYSLLDLLPALVGVGPRIILDYHGVTPPSLWDPAHRRRLDEAQRQRGLVWCADAAVVHSEASAEELHRATGYPRERMVRIGCVTDLTCWSPGPPDRDVRGERGLGEATVLLFVGRLAATKRVGLLIEALTRLRDLARPAHAVLIGDSSDIYEDELRKCLRRAEELGVADRCHALGRLPDDRLRAWYRSADVLVIPSRHEGFCLPVVEAMACGLCVVSTNVDGLPFLLEDERDALLVAPGDAQAMSAAVRRILTEPGLALRLSENARRKVEAFDWSMVLPRWLSIFEEAMIGRSNGCGA